MEGVTRRALTLVLVLVAASLQVIAETGAVITAEPGLMTVFGLEKELAARIRHITSSKHRLAIEPS